MNANDSTEAGEVPLDCNAGAGVADDRTVLEIGINDGCGSFVEVAVYAAPTAFVCDIGASAGNWVCVIAHGHAYADTRNAVDAEMADLTIGLNGDVDCSVPATIVLTRRNFEVAELVTPVARCGEPAAACSNGKDDDGDGQVDAPSERKLRPDPGCMNANDSTEAGEVPLTCNAGAGVGEDPSQLQIGINDGCGSFVDVAVYAAPTAFVCDVAASAGNWVCVIAHGHPFAETRTAAADMADLTIGLNGPADCAVPATIALTRPNLEVAELVTPIARCGQAAPACSNGVDDDSDGMADAREFGVDPDPGCSGTSDTSEDSEVALPAGCTIGGGNLGGDPRFPAVEASGCGAVTGMWFKPSAMPQDCVYSIGAGALACSVTGATVGATFGATTATVALGGHTSSDTTCGAVTIAVTLADGRVAALRDDWC
jgi:hypothetical protein